MYLISTRRQRFKVRHRRAAGFSLVEVMVALVITAIGLLGLAKMESVSLASSSVAGIRSLVAIQAFSLAAAMHANQNYWAAGLFTGDTTITSSGGTITVADVGSASGLTATGTNCTAAGTCTLPVQVAAYDVHRWATALQTLLPTYFATIICSHQVGVVVTCTVTIQWAENAVALNSTTQSQLSGLQSPTYTLYVQP
jgi:type IV pilus assembly protein PilV